MQEISIQEMMDAGAHFGHQTRRWNPKMKPYLYGVRSGIHIIDLQQTHSLAKKAVNLALDVVSKGKSVLFVGTKIQAQGIMEEEARRCEMPFVTRRWLGGMLTNFVTIRRSVDRLIDIETRREKNDFQGFTKKELLGIDREIVKLEATLGGIKTMNTLPGALFIVDTTVERIAIHEANLLGIPVIAILDSNSDPDPIDYPVPANDDALRSIQVFTSKIADACLAGLEKRQELAKEEKPLNEEAAPKKKPMRKAQDIEGKGRAYVGKLKEDVSGEEAVDSFSASAETQPDQSVAVSESATEVKE